MDLPPPSLEQTDEPNGLTPQDLTDRRVDAHHDSQQAFYDFESDMEKDPYLSLDRFEDHRRREKGYENAQTYLDQQTMARMGQQGEADEMDAMGVPEMSRTLSERPRMPPVGADDLHPDDLDEMSDEEVGAYTDEVEARGPTNPFPRPTMKSLDAAWSHLSKALY